MNFFYSQHGGALMCDEAVPDLTQTLVEWEPQQFYGGRHFVCETVTKKAAMLIADALGGKWIEKPISP